MPPATTIATEGDPFSRGARVEPESLLLVIAWSLHEPHRVGEVAVVPGSGSELILGRATPTTAARAFGSFARATAWRMREELAFAATAGSHALILGESGTGEELTARAIHALSSRAAGPFVARSISCAYSTPPASTNGSARPRCGDLLSASSRDQPRPRIAEARFPRATRDARPCPAAR